jgi:hypothetical protein
VRDPRSFPASDDGLEELGDEVIIAQETGAHAPQPRAQVTTDHPTVVISEPPLRDTRRRSRRERTEQTVVIRDRKQLEKMRRAISDRNKPRTEARSWYLLGAAALASLALGTLIAALVDATAGASTPAPALVPEKAAPLPEPAPSLPQNAIDLDALPDAPPKPRRADSVNQ